MEHLQGWEFFAFGIVGCLVGFICGVAHSRDYKNRIIEDLQRALAGRLGKASTRRLTRAQFNEECV
jgi:hypothetical protein